MPFLLMEHHFLGKIFLKKLLKIVIIYNFFRTVMRHYFKLITTGVFLL